MSADKIIPIESHARVTVADTEVETHVAEIAKIEATLMGDVDVIAQGIRAEALSGYNWNVPAWKNADVNARNIWLSRAAEAIRRAAFNAWFDARTSDKSERLTP